MPRIRVILLKEWRESLRNKMILFGAIFLPLFMVGAALVMVYQGRGIDVPGVHIALFNTALMYFLILPTIIPLAIAAYSIIGEKEQGSLEPLLATPIPEDLCREINLGYIDPSIIDPAEYEDREDEGILVVPHAGEMLFRLADGSVPDIDEL